MTKRTKAAQPEETIRPKNGVAEQLKQGAVANARRDLELAQDWFSFDEEASLRTPSAL